MEAKVYSNFREAPSAHCKIRQKAPSDKSSIVLLTVRMYSPKNVRNRDVLF